MQFSEEEKAEIRREISNRVSSLYAKQTCNGIPLFAINKPVHFFNRHRKGIGGLEPGIYGITKDDSLGIVYCDSERIYCNNERIIGATLDKALTCANTTTSPLLFDLFREGEPYEVSIRVIVSWQFINEVREAFLESTNETGKIAIKAYSLALFDFLFPEICFGLFSIGDV